VAFAHFFLTIYSRCQPLDAPTQYMAPIQIFENELVALIGNPSALRPFVCKGSPLDCQAFIVGINPATSGGFWEFWRSGHGFDKAAWFEAYKKDRKSRPLRPGKTRRSEISNTRRVIEWIVESASPIRCFETNLFSTPTARANELTPTQRDTAPFEFLLKKIAPQVIVAHGVDAAKHFEKMHLPATIISVSHFSVGWSQDRAKKLGRQIRSACG
jgi:hypothetical protein